MVWIVLQVWIVDMFKFYELDLYNITNQFGYFKLLMFYN